METVRFELRPDGCGYFCSHMGDYSGRYVSKKDYNAEVAQLKAAVEALEAENNALREDAALFKADAKRLEAELAEVREFWKSTANAFASEVADCTELREAVAWYFEALEFHSVHIAGLRDYYSQCRIGMKYTRQRNWIHNGNYSAKDILPAAEAELKRLAGVK